MLVEQAVSRRPLALRWLPVMLAGFLRYRLSGRYRIRHAGGPPGMSHGFPERIIDTGPYAVRIPWYDARAAEDEARLEQRFGAEYAAYRDRVPRWIGRPAR